MKYDEVHGFNMIDCEKVTGRLLLYLSKKWISSLKSNSGCAAQSAVLGLDQYY